MKLESLQIQKLRDELADRKVAVWRHEENCWRPIPVALLPTVVTHDEWLELERDARLIFGAFPKVLKWLQDPINKALCQRVFMGLSEFEIFMASQTPETQWGHVTTRLDLFWHKNVIKIIEVNCTIPAMQAYSDNVLDAWSHVFGGDKHWLSNTQQLLQSLIAMYRINGGSLAFPRIVILHREGDSQRGELLWFQKKWTELGYQTILATPDQVSRAGDVWLVGGEPCDVIYRHIFAWRLGGKLWQEYLKDNRRHHIYNPVSSHYEAKAFLALTSQIADDAELSTSAQLTSEEIRAIRGRVPWSRVLGAELSSSHIDQLFSRLDDLVIKRSVGYGGHHVIMGDEWQAPTIQDKLRQITGLKGKVGFLEFVDWARNKDESLWIVQERMSGARRRTEVLTRDGLEVWDAWYDASIFINTRTPPICHGGVSRIAQSPVVNIGTGGGLAPFVIASF